MSAAVAFGVLVVVLVVVGRGLGARVELVVTLAGSVLVVVTGVLPFGDALDALRDLGPTVGFLAAILVVAAVVAASGLFGRAGRAVRDAAHTPRRLVVVVVALVAGITALLSLDATVVLFTPAVVLAVADRRESGEPALLATTQVANAGSLPLPVSNLTNLLVLPATGLTFAGFALRMWAPALAAVGVVGGVGVALAPRPVRALVGRDDRALPPLPADLGRAPRPTRAEIMVITGVVGLLAALVGTSWLGVDAPIVAGVGALLLAGLGMGGLHMRPAQLARATAPGFLVFVLALGVVVAAASAHGLGDAVAGLVPSGAGFTDLLAVALLAAVLANLVNNLPAALLMLTALPNGAVGPLLAVLVGVNVGANLTYSGSLATLLWRRTVRAAGVEPAPRTFYRAAWIGTPIALAAATAALWLTLAVT